MFLFQLKQKMTPQQFKDAVNSTMIDLLGSTPRWNYGWDGKGNTTTIDVDIKKAADLPSVANAVNKTLRDQGAPRNWGVTFESSNSDGVATFSVGFEVPKLPGTKSLKVQPGKEQKGFLQ